MGYGDTPHTVNDTWNVTNLMHITTQIDQTFSLLDPFYVVKTQDLIRDFANFCQGFYFSQVIDLKMLGPEVYSWIEKADKRL